MKEELENKRTWITRPNEEYARQLLSDKNLSRETFAIFLAQKLKENPNQYSINIEEIKELFNLNSIQSNEIYSNIIKPVSGYINDNVKMLKHKLKYVIDEKNSNELYIFELENDNKI